MALVIYGYDFICFALVAGAIFGSLWVIRRTEGDQICDDATRYESLLFDRSDRDGFVGQMRNGHVGSTQLWMSCWREVHPGWLLATRAVSAFVLAGFLAWDIRCYDSTIFVYYTEWTVALVIIYFALGTVISAHGCWMYSKHRLENEERGGRSRKADLEESKSTVTTYKTAKISGAIEGEGHHEQEIIKQRAGFWGYLMQTVYQACAGAVMLTDIVFWCLIVPFLSIQHFSLNMLMGCMHTLNAVFLLLDTILNDMPFPWFRLTYFVLWSCIYIIFQWVIHACGFPWYLCLALIHIPCYGLYALIVEAKNSIFPRLFPQAYVKPY
ncbi:uncharacterized protein LOC131225733 isoform X2 [Magnolia sinica]|uniref:uncharacterized protein LOC131225733 isoform X2 n=1 Tax=Magnolia sinica TaxID=86752 RepID=UPI002659EA25|nr:uncharacterized protein LOC131225733 isoform X2 [Magnolia sinica]